MLTLPFWAVVWLNLIANEVSGKCRNASFPSSNLKSGSGIPKLKDNLKSENHQMEVSRNGTENSTGYRSSNAHIRKLSGYRIIGGKKMPRNEIPWQVALVWMDDTAILCGGTIICPKFVMTAAHCTKDKKADYIQIVAGAHQLSNGNEKHQTRHNVAKIHDHPDYKEVVIEGCEGLCEYPDYDYSILELSRAIEIDKQARPVYLPNKGDTKFNGPRTKFAVSGWGQIKAGDWDSTQDKLRGVSVPWVSTKDCQKNYNDRGIKLSPRMLCSGDIKIGYVDACQGDSGGPLTWLDKKSGKPGKREIKLVGVVSFGLGCGEEGYAGVSAAVSKVVGWVKKVTGNCNRKICKDGKTCETDKMLHEEVRLKYRRPSRIPLFQRAIFHKSL